MTFRENMLNAAEFHWSSINHQLHLTDITVMQIRIAIFAKTNSAGKQLLTGFQTRNNHTLRWRHNDQDGVSNHQPHGCLLNRLFRRRSNKTSKLRVTGLCVGNSPGPVNSPHKGPVTRKMFPFDDVIMIIYEESFLSQNRNSCIIRTHVVKK